MCRLLGCADFIGKQGDFNFNLKKHALNMNLLNYLTVDLISNDDEGIDYSAHVNGVLEYLNFLKRSLSSYARLAFDKEMIQAY